VERTLPHSLLFHLPFTYRIRTYLSLLLPATASRQTLNNGAVKHAVASAVMRYTVPAGHFRLRLHSTAVLVHYAPLVQTTERDYCTAALLRGY